MKGLYFYFLMFLLSSCLTKPDDSTVEQPIVYCGFADNQYFEFWIYSEEIVVFEELRGYLAKFDFDIKNDSLFMFSDSILERSFRILFKNNDKLILESQSIIGTLYRIRDSQEVDAYKVEEGFNDSILSPQSDSLHNLFIYDSFTRREYVDSIINNQDSK